MTLDGEVLLMVGSVIAGFGVAPVIWKVMDKKWDEVMDKSPYTIDIFHKEPSTTYKRRTFQGDKVEIEE